MGLAANPRIDLQVVDRDLSVARLDPFQASQ
jgi:hypothetical protein